MAMGLREKFAAASDCDERARVASAYANIGKMWCSAQDAKREILGKPKAGVRKHAVEKKNKPTWYWEDGMVMDRDPSLPRDFEPSDPRNADCSGGKIAATVPQPDHSESRPAESPIPTAPWQPWRA
jgi:hypothetical protein